MKLKVNNFNIEFVYRRSMKCDKSTAWRKKHSDFNVPCLAIPELQIIVSLKNISGNGGVSKLESYAAFDIHIGTSVQSLLDATDIISKEYTERKKKKFMRYQRWDNFYYYTSMSNDDLIKFYLDDSLNCDIMIYDKSKYYFKVNVHTLIGMKLRRYKLKKLAEL
jgi:hypothetical protein